jgi:hypothetical protein
MDTIYAGAAFLVYIPAASYRLNSAGHGRSGGHETAHRGPGDVASSLGESSDLRKPGSIPHPSFTPTSDQLNDGDTESDDGFLGSQHTSNAKPMKREFDKLDGLDVTAELVEAGSMGDTPRSRTEFKHFKYTL